MNISRRTSLITFNANRRRIEWSGTSFEFSHKTKAETNSKDELTFTNDTVYGNMQIVVNVTERTIAAIVYSDGSYFPVGNLDRSICVRFPKEKFNEAFDFITKAYVGIC